MADAIVGGLSPAEIRALPMADRQDLKDELSKGEWTDEYEKPRSQEQEAYSKIWRAENEAALKQALKDQQAMLTKKLEELKKWDNAAKVKVKTWFGNADENIRDVLIARIERILELGKNTTIDKFRPLKPGVRQTIAGVNPPDKERYIYIGQEFLGKREIGIDSKAVILCHEMSHFCGIGDTVDERKKPRQCISLALNYPPKTIHNSYSFEYFMGDFPTGLPS